MRETRVPQYWSDGMVSTHDQACAVCWEGPAVWVTHLGYFDPCWKCQGLGWKLTKKNWWRRPWDRCRVDGRVIWTKSGYDMCAKHGGR